MDSEVSLVNHQPGDMPAEHSSPTTGAMTGFEATSTAVEALNEATTKNVVRSKRLLRSTASQVSGQINTLARKSRTWNQTRHLRRLQTFTLFPKLPVEVRLLIWELLLPDYAIHEVRKVQNLENCSKEYFYLLQEGFPATMAKPVLLQINVEARYVALSAYTPLLSRNSVVAAVGQKLYPWDDIGAPGKYSDPSGHIITEKMPEVGDHVFKGRFFDPPIPVRGVLIKFPKRSFVDLKHDTLYFNYNTYCHEHYGKSLKEINQFVTLEDSCKVKHLAIDYKIWSTADPKHDWYPEDLGYAKYQDERLRIHYRKIWQDRPAHINKLDLQFGYLFEDGAFDSLESLTLVFCDCGPTAHYDNSQKEFGPIAFVEEDDLGSMFRRKGGRQPGPYASVAWQIGMPTLPNPAAVLAQIEVLKADTAAQVAELKEKKPDLRIPEIKWRFARRNGKFQSQLNAIRR